MAKETQGGKGIFDLPFYILILHWRKLGEELKQGKYLEAEADTEVIVKKKNAWQCVVCFTLFTFWGTNHPAPKQITHTKAFYYLRMPSLSLSYFLQVFLNLSYPDYLMPLGFYLSLYLSVYLYLLLSMWLGVLLGGWPLMFSSPCSLALCSLWFFFYLYFLSAIPTFHCFCLPIGCSTLY